MNDRQLPVFVYGTLRHGDSNYHLLRNRTSSEVPASVSGVTLFALPHYPMLMEGDSTAYGELMTIDGYHYVSVMHDLDALEGYTPGGDCLYYRVEWDVKVSSGDWVQAWLYLGNPLYLTMSPHVIISHGDWSRFRQEQIG